MENSKFRQLCEKINYNTYVDIRNTLAISTVGLVLTDNLLVQHYPMLNHPFDLIVWAAAIANGVMIFSSGQNHTKDVIEIRSLYQEFIKKYNELNKIFDLNNPIQIHTMFYYLLKKGYLSKDKRFHFSVTKARDIDCIKGSNVIVGQGVCRHISSMLTDILNDYDIESYELSMYIKEPRVNINLLDEKKYTKEELVNWVNDNTPDTETCNDLMELIEIIYNEYGFGIEFSKEMIDDKNPIKRKLGNHLITCAFKDEKNYFLDPTYNKIYRQSESNERILYNSEGEYPISIVLNDDKKKHTRMKKLIKSHYPSISCEEEKALTKETIKLCSENIDIFENFYNENSELYDGISGKVLKIKKL